MATLIPPLQRHAVSPHIGDILGDALLTDEHLGHAAGDPGSQPEACSGDERQAPCDDRKAEVAPTQQQSAGDDPRQPDGVDKGIGDAGSGAELPCGHRFHDALHFAEMNATDVTICVVKRLPAIRERTEELERASLSTWAALAAETKGRDVQEEPDPLRTSYQVDRDRLLACGAFQRLKHKSHLLLGDGHRRVRASHALEVGKVARTLGRGLRLNEDLIEAMALGHDLGNTAFGTVGEQALAMATGETFRHAEQSLRVVEHLENDGAGLNLTWEVRDGIVGHLLDGPAPATHEGQTLRRADRIAAATHDVPELCRVGLLDDADIPREVTATLGTTYEEWQATLIRDVITESIDEPELRGSTRVDHALEVLLETGRSCLARTTSVAQERNRAMHCLSSIAVYWLQHADTLPATATDPVQRVVDAVSSLTDREALDEFHHMFLPSS